MLEPLGLIAGDGRLPIQVARVVRRRGRRVIAVAFCGLTDPELERVVDGLHWLRLGELESLLEALRKADVRVAVMAGKVPKLSLFQSQATRQLDSRARRFLAGLPDRGDDSILAGFATLLESEGVALCSQLELVPELCVDPGPLGSSRLTEAQRSDVEFGWSMAKAIGALDIGQTVVVRDRAVLAVEAIEGSDEAIRRGGKLAGSGASVIKVAKPAQDSRFDTPVVGPATIESLIAVQAAVLAFEAAKTIVLDRDELIELADAHGIPVIGLGSSGELGLEEAER